MQLCWSSALVQVSTLIHSSALAINVKGPYNFLPTQKLYLAITGRSCKSCYQNPAFSFPDQYLISCTPHRSSLLTDDPLSWLLTLPVRHFILHFTHTIQYPPLAHSNLKRGNKLYFWEKSLNLTLKIKLPSLPSWISSPAVTLHQGSWSRAHHLNLFAVP
jgi:hypothetical protein